jgi:hypothetical protein
MHSSTIKMTVCLRREFRTLPEIEGEINHAISAKRVFTYRVADRCGDHPDHRGNRHSQSFAESDSSQSGFSHREPADHEHGGGELPVHLQHGIHQYPSAARPSGGGSPATPSAAGLLDSVLVSGVKSGYSFTYTPQTPDAQGRYLGYTVNADPSQPGVTGTGHYYTDNTYVIQGNNTGVASAASSPVAN